MSSAGAHRVCQTDHRHDAGVFYHGSIRDAQLTGIGIEVSVPDLDGHDRA